MHARSKLRTASKVVAKSKCLNEMTFEKMLSKTINFRQDRKDGFSTLVMPEIEVRKLKKQRGFLLYITLIQKKGRNRITTELYI